MRNGSSQFTDHLLAKGEQELDRQMSTCAIDVYTEMANHLPDMA
jgi:hypothetical protein